MALGKPKAQSSSTAVQPVVETSPAVANLVGNTEPSALEIANARIAALEAQIAGKDKQPVYDVNIRFVGGGKFQAINLHGETKSIAERDEIIELLKVAGITARPSFTNLPKDHTNMAVLPAPYRVEKTPAKVSASGEIIAPATYTTVTPYAVAKVSKINGLTMFETAERIAKALRSDDTTVG